MEIDQLSKVPRMREEHGFLFRRKKPKTVRVVGGQGEVAGAVEEHKKEEDVAGEWEQEEGEVVERDNDAVEEEGDWSSDVVFGGKPSESESDFLSSSESHCSSASERDTSSIASFGLEFKEDGKIGSAFVMHGIRRLI